MARATKREVRNTIESLNIVNDKAELLIEELLRQDEITSQLIAQREQARDSGEHSKFVELDTLLLSSLSKIEDMERAVVEQLNKDIDFDKLDNASRVDFMLNENADKKLENDMIEFKVKSTRDEYIKSYNDKSEKIDQLTEEKGELESELEEMEKQDNPDLVAIGRKKRDIVEIEEKIQALQKEMEKMQEVFRLDTDNYEELIEKNKRIIQNNMKNLDFKNIDPKNYGKATELISNMYNSKKKEQELFPMSSEYAPFKDIMTAEEFKYLTQNYERETGSRLKFNKDSKTGILYNLLHKHDMEQMVKARYPHLAAKENKGELKRIVKEQGDALAVMMQSGITGNMLRNLHRDIEADVRYYQSRTDRSDWLKGLRIEQDGQSKQVDPQTRTGKDDPIINNTDPQVDDPRTDPQGDSKTDPQVDPKQPTNNDKSRQTKIDDFNDPVNVLNGIEKLGLDPKVIVELKRATIYNIGDLIDVLNKNGIDLSATQKVQDKTTKSKRIITAGDIDNVINKTVKPNKKHDINVDWDALDQMKTGKKAEPDIIDFENLPDDPNYIKTKTSNKKSNKQQTGTGIDNVSFSDKMSKALQAQKIKTVEELKAKLEKGEDIEGFNQSAYKVFRQYCKSNDIDINVDWEARIKEFKNKKPAKQTSAEKDKTENTQKSKSTKKKVEPVKSIDVNEVSFSGTLKGKLETQGITTVQELVTRLEKGEDIEGFNQSGYKVLRTFCKNEKIDTSINFEQRIAELSNKKPKANPAPKQEKKEPPKVSKKIQKAMNKAQKQKEEQETKNNFDMDGILSDRNILYKNDDTIQKHSHDDDRDDR